MVLATREVTTVAGLLGEGGGTDGIGASALFYSPVALTADGAGNLYVADSGNSTIRKIMLSSGQVTTLAGAAAQPDHRDGRGGAARFQFPNGLALDGARNLYVSDLDNTIRRIVLATSEVTTVAGAANVEGSEDGLGEVARFAQPKGLVADGTGSLYVADTGNCTIRQIVIATGRTTTLAGSAETRDGGDGTGSSAHFQAPVALVMDLAGRLLVADSFDDTIRRIDLSTNEVTTVVGHSGRWQTIPGPLPAYVSTPGGLAVLPSGDLVISDQDKNIILLARF
jgi:hypothetical protein